MQFFVTHTNIGTKIVRDLKRKQKREKKKQSGAKAVTVPIPVNSVRVSIHVFIIFSNDTVPISSLMTILLMHAKH